MTSDQDYILQTSTLCLVLSAGLSASKQRYFQAESTSESALPYPSLALSLDRKKLEVKGPRSTMPGWESCLCITSWHCLWHTVRLSHSHLLIGISGMEGRTRAFFVRVKHPCQKWGVKLGVPLCLLRFVNVPSYFTSMNDNLRPGIACWHLQG